MQMILIIMQIISKYLSLILFSDFALGDSHLTLIDDASSSKHYLNKLLSLFCKKYFSNDLCCFFSRTSIMYTEFHSQHNIIFSSHLLNWSIM